MAAAALASDSTLRDHRNLLALSVSKLVSIIPQTHSTIDDLAIYLLLAPTPASSTPPP